ncbi:MAG: triose-phosphate isomerase [Acidobacteriota bacterium]
MSRRPILAANWKMHLLRADAEAFCEALTAEPDHPGVDVVIFPAAPLLGTVARGLEGSAVALGGQDVHPAAAGAHTGDVSAPQLLDAGCTWALCGHSERRRDHGEDDALVAEKAAACRAHGLIPLVCVGETLEERHDGRTFEVLSRQLGAILDAELDTFELAYEPVWAIGTGEVATPEVAQGAHDFLRGELRDRLGGARADTTRILYGGSAKPGNVDALFQGDDIDGFLVGGASLDSNQFSAMIGSLR